MPANKPTTMLPRLVTWLHAGGELIVYYSLRLVDGARLPYTRRMLDAREMNYVPEFPVYTSLAKAS